MNWNWVFEVVISLITVQAAAMAVSFYYTWKAVRDYRRLQAVKRAWVREMDEWRAAEIARREAAPVQPDVADALKETL